MGTCRDFQVLIGTDTDWQGLKGMPMTFRDVQYIVLLSGTDLNLLRLQGLVGTDKD